MDDARPNKGRLNARPYVKGNTLILLASARGTFLCLLGGLHDVFRARGRERVRLKPLSIAYRAQSHSFRLRM